MNQKNLLLGVIAILLLVIIGLLASNKESGSTQRQIDAGERGVVTESKEDGKPTEAEIGLAIKDLMDTCITKAAWDEEKDAEKRKCLAVNVNGDEEFVSFAKTEGEMAGTWYWVDGSAIILGPEGEKEQKIRIKFVRKDDWWEGTMQNVTVKSNGYAKIYVPR